MSTEQAAMKEIVFIGITWSENSVLFQFYDRAWSDSTNSGALIQISHKKENLPS